MRRLEFVIDPRWGFRSIQGASFCPDADVDRVREHSSSVRIGALAEPLVEDLAQAPLLVLAEVCDEHARETATSRQLTLHPFEAQVLRDERIFRSGGRPRYRAAAEAWRQPSLYRAFCRDAAYVVGASSQELAVRPDRKVVISRSMCRREQAIRDLLRAADGFGPILGQSASSRGRLCAQLRQR